MRNHTNRENEGESAFGTTYNKGYFMNINGHRISVQFGTGNYVDSDIRYGRQENVINRFDTSMNFAVWQSNLAEVMIDIIDGDGAILNTGASDDWIKDGRGGKFRRAREVVGCKSRCG